MTEPIYIAQNGDLTNSEEARRWFRETSERGRREVGADHFRYSVHPEIPNLVLVEGWIGYPERWKYGHPRWLLSLAK